MTRKSTTVLMYAFLILCSVISIFPLLWMVIAAMNRSVDVIAGKLTIGANLVQNYHNLMPPRMYGTFSSIPGNTRC